MTQHFNIDRRAMLAGMGAMALPGAALAKPADYPAVQAFLNDFVGGGKLADCVVAIARKGKAVEYLAKGNLALDSDIPAGRDSLFRVFSMTKPITGIAFMTLVEKGVLRLDQPISDILPEFANPKVIIDGDVTKTRPAAGPILMRHLITHTSGLSYHINTASPVGRLYQKNGLTAGTRPVAVGLSSPSDIFPPARDLETFGRRLATMPLENDPGTRWQYSFGLDLMGLIIQRAAGMPFEDYLNEAIIDPLGMVDTDFVCPRSKQSRLTTMYVGRGPLIPFDNRNSSMFSRDRDLPSGGGGLLSTAQDYIKFCQMLMGDGRLGRVQILKPETVAIARSNLMPPGLLTRGAPSTDGNGFGAAMQVLTAASAPGEGQGTYGWYGAAGTTMWIDPVHEVAVVGMIQIQGGASILTPLREAVYKDMRAKGWLKA